MISRRTAGLTAAAAAMVAGSFVVAGTVGQSAGASAPAQENKSDVVRSARAGSDVFGPATVVPPGSNGIATARCPRGTTLTGGGGSTSGINVFFTDSYRTSGRIWLVRGTNTGGADQSISAFARCL
jgi:hypothetical protein